MYVSTHFGHTTGNGDLEKFFKFRNFFFPNFPSIRRGRDARQWKTRKISSRIVVSDRGETRSTVVANDSRRARARAHQPHCRPRDLEKFLKF